jgi:hypothetical protein
MEHQHVVDDGVVFLLEHVLGEIRDSARSLLLASVGTRLGMSRLISDVDIWRRVLVCSGLCIPSPPRGSCIYTHRCPLVQVELGRQVWIRSE